MKLLRPKGFGTRPIIDRVKESLFSVLYKYDLPSGKLVADLFCGTGSLGLEALSRGAAGVTFVEKSREVAEILKKNIEKADFFAESKVIVGDAFTIAVPCADSTAKYDLVFVDPPYTDSADTQLESPLGKLLVLLSEQIATQGIVAVRTQRKHHLLDKYGKLKIMDRRQWGTMAVTLLGHRDPNSRLFAEWEPIINAEEGYDGQESDNR